MQFNVGQILRDVQVRNETTWWFPDKQHNMLNACATTQRTFRRSDKKNKNVTLKKSSKLVLVDNQFQDLLKVEREFH